MPDVPPYVNINVQEVTTINETAQHIVAGFARSTPVLADTWRLLESALNDVPMLVGEISRLAEELQDTRLERANLLAAARATLAAHYDGDPDPLYYLRDELNTRRSLPPDLGGRA